MDTQTLQQLVSYVRKAQDEKYAIDKITKTLRPTLTTEEGYLIQSELIRQRLAEGDGIAGPKMGFTSLAKLQQMRAKDPIYGYVLTSMLVKNGGRASAKDYIHPKVEPEIGFVLKNPLRGPGITAADVLRNTQSIFAAIEIIDSRYKNFDFTLPDVVADNSSAAGAVLGAFAPLPAGLDLLALPVVLKIDGAVAKQGTGADVLGNPANSVAYLANMLAQGGAAVPAGQPILTGGVTAAVPVAAGSAVEVELANGQYTASVSFTA